MKNERGNRDIIVIGGSAGALEPMKHLMAAFPTDLPAAVFVVLHIGATSYLAPILDRASLLPVIQARGGQPIEHGCVYVGVPDRHLLLQDGHMLLRRGPRENMARPAIDPLFRSAACSFGGRVIGVLLSGSLNDGAAGLQAIKRCGGVAMIQDPKDAEVPEMPRNARDCVAIDHALPIARLGQCLVARANEPAGDMPQIPRVIQLAAAVAAQEVAGISAEERLGLRAPFSCPECHGPLWEIADPALLRYRCHIGHAFAVETLLEAEAREADQTLQSLARLTRERAELVQRLAERAAEGGHSHLAAQMQRRAEEYRHDAKLLDGLLLRSAIGAGIAPGPLEELTATDGEGQE